MLILYDGECVFCNRFVRWVLKTAERSQISVEPLDPSKHTALLGRTFQQYGQDTIYLVDSGSILTKSSAILRIIRQRSGFFNLLSRALSSVPSQILDRAYDFVAKNRRKVCDLPPAK
jgi:predicted DCC family thiol-disulfide oxidoreductase YuxK